MDVFEQNIHCLFSATNLTPTPDSTALLPINYSSMGPQTTAHTMQLQVAAALLSFEIIPHAALFYFILFLFTSFPGLPLVSV